MGSLFTRYKTPALVKLDYTTTFTPVLLLKDMDLGLDAADRYGVPMQIASRVRDTVHELIDIGFAKTDFAALLELRARVSNLELIPEDPEGAARAD